MVVVTKELDRYLPAIVRLIDDIPSNPNLAPKPVIEPCGNQSVLETFRGPRAGQPLHALLNMSGAFCRSQGTPEVLSPPTNL